MKNKLDYTFLGLVICLMYYIFSLSAINLLSLLAGIAFTAIAFHKHSEAKKRDSLWQSILGAFLVTFFLNFIGTTNIALIVTGANLISLYYFFKTSKFFNLSVFNITVLAEITFFSAIQKFRGFNKLNTTDIQTTIPLIVTTAIISYLLLNIIKLMSPKLFKNLAKNSIYVVSAYFAIMFYTVGFFLYEETGPSIIFAPLMMGLLGALLNSYVTSVYKRFLLVAFLIILPYGVSGLMGIGLAFLANYVCSFIFQELLNPTSKGNTDTDLLYPLMFLFTSAELRENAGQIVRFNLVTGNVMGWTLLSILFYNLVHPALSELEKTLTENELANYIPAVKTLLAILGLIVIMKIGGDNALATLITAGSIYLFTSDIVTTKKQLGRKFTLSLTGLIGSVSFLVLTNI